MEISPITLLHKTASVVCAFVSHNSLPVADLPGLIESVHASFRRIDAPPTEQVPEPASLKLPPGVTIKLPPGVTIKNSVQPDFVTCLEDGKKFKSLKRHLRTQYNLSPDEYRAKWGLSAAYPMVAPSYAKARSDLAITMGLGANRRKQATAAAPAATPAAANKPAAARPAAAKAATPKRKAA